MSVHALAYHIVQQVTNNVNATSSDAIWNFPVYDRNLACPPGFEWNELPCVQDNTTKAPSPSVTQVDLDKPLVRQEDWVSVSRSQYLLTHLLLTTSRHRVHLLTSMTHPYTHTPTLTPPPSRMRSLVTPRNKSMSCWRRWSTSTILITYVLYVLLAPCTCLITRPA